jgi:hypothetical protein
LDSCKAGEDVYLASFGSVSNLTATANGGSALILGRDQLAATTVTAAQTIQAVSLGDVSGIYTAQGRAAVFAKENSSASVEARENAVVTAGKNLSGMVKSNQADAVATSLGLDCSAGTGGGTVRVGHGPPGSRRGVAGRECEWARGHHARRCHRCGQGPWRNSVGTNRY